MDNREKMAQLLEEAYQASVMIARRENLVPPWYSDHAVLSDLLSAYLWKVNLSERDQG